ncbi:MAG: ABC transporter ATP-binding protein [Desulfobulbaceae bacterium]|nr:ABC transporter ATP-binding protein [Desulfobulbaceae bacterium]
MSNTVIKAEGLGKSYLIGHQQREPYLALREVMTNGIRQWWSRLRNPQYGSHGELEEFWALKEVDFEIKQGDRVGIIGRNGAGKSTLLKILSRITEPTTGRIKIKGRVASLLEVGTGFHPELTGRENIFLNGAILGMSRAEIKKKFDEIVDFAEVEKFLDTPVKRYSSGMYVRLAFAVAAHLEPEILIVDEVLAVGDAQFQKKCLGKMEEVGKQGRTVLFVSHNMATISALCSRSILLANGNIVAEGRSKDVIESYLLSFNEANICLSERKDRSGNGEAKICDVYFADTNGNRVEMLTSGSQYDIVMKYRAQVPLVAPCFKISVYSSAGQLIAHMNNWLCNYMPSLPKGKGEVRCHIDALPFAFGSYRVNASINTDETLDHVDCALVFKVENGDYYGTGRVIDGLKEVCLVKQDWKMDIN